MKISYGITCCNELEEIQRLIPFLHKHKRPEDEICVLLDKPKASPLLLDQLYRYSSANWILLKESAFQNHFADWKNELTQMCSGDFIFQIDADEIPNKALLENLPEILQANPDHEVYYVPRVNTVEGLTQEHIQKWGWIVDNHGRVNWPDLQWRLYRKDKRIYWVNKVHEKLEGYKSIAALPGNYSLGKLFLYHIKNIEKQEKQNQLYDTI